MSAPEVSVFIRVRDEAAALGRVLQALGEQQLNRTVEVVVLDNESRDGSPDIAAASGAVVYTWPREQFGYGKALNLGAELCRGDVIVFLSAHSIPSSPTWLAELVDPVFAGSASAAFCRQVPSGRISRIEAHRFALLAGPDRYLDRDAFISGCLKGLDPYELGQFSNSACAIRKSVVHEHQFRDLPYAEDRAFAIDVVMAGGIVAFLHSPAIRYHRGSTWQSAYQVAVRAQVSKRLIREVAAVYVGYRYSSVAETVSRFFRALAVPIIVTVRVVASVAEPRGVRWLAVRDSVVASGASLGLARGCMVWRNYRQTLSSDRRAVLSAQRLCVLVADGSSR